MASSSDDTIDSREIIEEINDLEVEISGLRDDIEEAEETIEELSEQQDNIDIDADGTGGGDFDALTNEIQELESTVNAAEIEISGLQSELKPLTDLQDDADGGADWRHGVTLIADDYFEDYAYEMAVDTGAISPDAGWPLNNIDWEKATAELQMDYTSVEFDGRTYWFRS